GQNRCARANGCSLLDTSEAQPPPIFVSCFHFGKPWRSGITIVGKCDSWTNEHTVLQADPVPDQRLVFYRHIVADDAARFDEAVLADFAVRADDDVSHNMSKRPDTSAITDLIGVDNRGWMSPKIFFHASLLATREGITRQKRSKSSRENALKSKAIE